MSLQDINVRNQFITTCGNLWNNWNTGPAGARQIAREGVIRGAVQQMTNFMVPPTVVFAATGGWGSFSWPSWRLKLNHKYTQKSDIKYGKFLEFCSTIYHESRHAEQFYRIAQGLAQGRLKFPDATNAEVLQSLGSGGGGVAAKVALFGGGKSGGAAVAATDGRPTATMIQSWLNIPLNIAQHAVTNAAGFDGFCNLAKPTWFKRPTTLLEVEDWMRATYKKTYSEMDSFAQSEDDADDARRNNVYRMYRNLPEEHDAHSIEDQVETDLKARIGHPGSLRQPRTNVALFGP